MNGIRVHSVPLTGGKAGTDCGFGTGAGMQAVVPSVVWAKLQAMAEGAALASEELR